jgi:hypothetical protein
MLPAVLLSIGHSHCQMVAQDIHAAPVLPKSKQSTFIGNTLFLFRLSMYVVGLIKPIGERSKLFSCDIIMNL